MEKCYGTAIEEKIVDKKVRILQTGCFLDPKVICLCHSYFNISYHLALITKLLIKIHRLIYVYLAYVWMIKHYLEKMKLIYLLV